MFAIAGGIILAVLFFAYIDYIIPMALGLFFLALVAIPVIIYWDNIVDFIQVAGMIILGFIFAALIIETITSTFHRLKHFVISASKRLKGSDMAKKGGSAPS